MLKYTLLAASALSLLAGAASAADLPKRAQAPVFAPLPPAFSWTGFYLGVNAGYAFSDNGKTSTIGTPAFVALGPTLVPGSLSTKKSGFIGGAQAGYNYQVGSIVYGLEGDVDFLGNRKTASFLSPGTVLGSPLRTSASSKLDYLATLRARLGFTPVDRLLVYGTGGFAFGNVKTNGAVVATAAPALAWTGSKDTMKTGFAVGAGAEYAFTNNITFKTEYLYYNLGKQTTYAAGNATVRTTPALNGIDYVSRTKTAGSIIRAGLNYKF